MHGVLGLSGGNLVRLRRHDDLVAGDEHRGYRGLWLNSETAFQSGVSAKGTGNKGAMRDTR